jgi:hypothetical protein
MKDQEKQELISELLTISYNLFDSLQDKIFTPVSIARERIEQLITKIQEDKIV